MNISKIARGYMEGMMQLEGLKPMAHIIRIVRSNTNTGCNTIFRNSPSCLGFWKSECMADPLDNKRNSLVPDCDMYPLCWRQS